MAAGDTCDYQVDLATFRGPLDLLLYLVKRDEIDLRDIPVARVAEQFKQYLDVLQVIDVERVGDFLVMAATLAELKSRMLLPRKNPRPPNIASSRGMPVEIRALDTLWFSPTEVMGNTLRPSSPMRKGNSFVPCCEPRYFTTRRCRVAIWSLTR